ncbi:MAG TPA: prepilin-type N-terminal cleavage/methylation domain-containing protein [Candidatus Saccharimonadia bacterium]
MQLTRHHQRGDTLIEVTIALAILSMTLMGATRLAVRAFQQGQTARERTALALTAQQQLEHLRNFRDTSSWTEFVNGSGSGLFRGVLSAHTGGPCQQSGCFTMRQNGSRFEPVDGYVQNSTVANSYVEIHAQAAGAKMVKFTVSWGFPDVSGGPDNVGHVVTQLTDLTAVLATTAPAPSGPVSTLDSPCTDGVAELVYNFVPMTLFENNYSTIDAYIDSNGLGYGVHNSVVTNGNGTNWPGPNPPQKTFTGSIGSLVGGNYPGNI